MILIFKHYSLRIYDTEAIDYLNKLEKAPRDIRNGKIVKLTASLVKLVSTKRVYAKRKRKRSDSVL